MSYAPFLNLYEGAHEMAASRLVRVRVRFRVRVRVRVSDRASAEVKGGQHVLEPSVAHHRPLRRASRLEGLTWLGLRVQLGLGLGLRVSLTLTLSITLTLTLTLSITLALTLTKSHRAPSAAPPRRDP